MKAFPEVDSEWRSTINTHTTYIVESVFDGYVTIISRRGTGDRFVRSIPEFWKFMRPVEPVKPQSALSRWADVEAALRAFNDAKREQDRLKAVADEASDRAREAHALLGTYKDVVRDTADAYGRELAKMEALVK